MVNSDFGGTPLVFGSTYGYRSFEYDWLGRLHAVSYGYRWTPGENVATCGSGNPRINSVTGEKESIAYENHMDHHTCGFYSYIDGTDHHDVRKPLVDGVIESYGRTVIGTKGSRSEKAKIVALHIPALSRHNRILRWYQRHSIGTRIGIPWRNVVFNGVIGGSVAFVLLLAAVVVWTTTSLILVALAIVLGVNSFYGFLAENHPEKDRKRYMESVLKGDEGPMVRIRQIYPDARIFTSKFAMRRAFPIKKFETEKIEIPSPETHENFWEMSSPK